MLSIGTGKEERRKDETTLSRKPIQAEEASKVEVVKYSYILIYILDICFIYVKVVCNALHRVN